MSADSTATRPEARPRGVWWLSPTGALLLVVPGPLYVAARLSDAEYRLQWRTPKALTDDTAILCVLATAVLCLASLLPQLAAWRPRAGRWPWLDEAQLHTLRRASSVVFALTVTGYLAFAAAGVARGVTIGSIVESIAAQDNYSGTLKEQFATIPGLTTLTQCGIAYVVIASILLAHGRDARTVRRMVLVFVLALLRAFINTERLALLELAVPAIGVAVMALARRRDSGSARTSANLAPVVLVPLVALVFGAFEYSRSWQFFSSRTDASFPSFVLTRMAGYYTTAYNNGQLRLDHAGYPGRLPYESVQLFWEAPVISQLGLYDKLSATPPAAAQLILDAHGNPEFNNPGGLLVPLVDFGTVGGMVFFAVAGLLVGMAYRAFTTGNPLGLFVYPLLLTGVFDLPRYIYWTQGRTLPALVCLLAVAWVVHRSGRSRGRATRSGDPLPERLQEATP